MKKRFLPLFLSGILLLGALPLPAAADEYEPGLCEHHTNHTPECGFSENTPCSFDCETCVNSGEEDPSNPDGSSEEEENPGNPDGSSKEEVNSGNPDGSSEKEENGSSEDVSSYDNELPPPDDAEDLHQINMLNTVVTEGYDQTVMVGPDGAADIQAALDSLPENSGNVLLRVDADVLPTGETFYSVPTDKGITALTIGTSSAVTIGKSAVTVRFFANGIPLTIDSGVTFAASSRIYGGGGEGASVTSGTSITVKPGAQVSGIFGGGRNSSVTGDVYIEINGTVEYLYGGGEAGPNASAPVDGKVCADIDGNVAIHVTGPQKNNLHGGGSASSASNTAYALQANVTGSVTMNLNSPSVERYVRIYGGGSAENHSASGSVAADVGGAVTITIGGDFRNTGKEDSAAGKTTLYGGGQAYNFADNAALLSARVYGGVSIDASANNHAIAVHDDWDNSMFMNFYGGGIAVGNVSDATVASTRIVISRKVLDDEAGLFGGCYASQGGKARVAGDTYVEICRAETQHATHDNAKAVYGGGCGDGGDATVDGNTTVVINPNITFEPSANQGPHGGGKVNGGGVAKVGGTANVIINGTNIAAIPGGRPTSSASKENCAVNAATVQYLGNVNLSFKSGGPVLSPVQIVIGDGSAETAVKANYVYCADGPGSKVSIRVAQNASLTQNADGNKMLWNVEDLDIARGGTVTTNCTKEADEKVNGTLSGEGTITLPATNNLQVMTDGALTGNLTVSLSAGKPVTVYGGFSGNTTINVSGNVQTGTLLAWSKPGQSGTFAYTGGNGFALVTDESVSGWVQWKLAATKTVTAAVNGDGGTVSPESQTVPVGSGADISLTPEPGYKIGLVMVGTVDRTADVQDGVLKLNDIQADTAVSVSFERLTAPDVENDIESLPPSEQPDADDAETILDVKMDLEALPETEKKKVPKDSLDKLNSALSNIPAVEVAITGDAALENSEILLDCMTGEEAALLKAGNYSKYRIEMVIAESQPENNDEQSSIDSALNGASEAAQHEVTVRKLITSSDQPDNPREEQISQLPRAVRLVFPIPAELQTVPDDLVRSFTMYRTHFENGTYNTTPLKDEDSSAETYTVISSQFSLYTLAYTDEISAYRITADAGAGGAITPSGIVRAPKNGSQTFTITANDGYYIKDVLVDGKSVGNVNSYTFSELTADHSISASFAKSESTEKPSGKPESTPGNTPGGTPGNIPGGTPGSTPGGGGDTPSTGDSGNPSLWVLIMLLSSGLAAGILGFRKRPKQQ